MVWIHADPGQRRAGHRQLQRVRAGVVRGYFVEPGTDCDYLGVYVEPDVPPDWWIWQQIQDGHLPYRCTMAFGAEIKPEPAKDDK